jgi:hypothetical protein
MSDVHFYRLMRATRKFDPAEKDEWSLPGALSPDEALKLFEGELGFGLKRIDADAHLGEFVLEQRERYARPISASMSPSIQAGRVLAAIWVERS